VETKAKGGAAGSSPAPAMASSSKASDSSSQRSKVSVASRFLAPRVRRPDLPNPIGFDLFRFMFPCFGCSAAAGSGDGQGRRRRLRSRDPWEADAAGTPNPVRAPRLH
jgi:hypothetical protein